MNKRKINTGNTQFILASSSKTRINLLKDILDRFTVTKHTIDEMMEKNENPKLNAKDLAKYLAKSKANSISKLYMNGYIIACDQTLECSKKIINKPIDLKQARSNLLFLSGKEHRLYTCLYVLKNAKEYFVEQQSAQIFFKKISEEKINKYIADNKGTALSCVGSYKIEDNNKYKFLKIIKGERESIVGFPIKKFIQKIMKKGL